MTLALSEFCFYIAEGPDGEDIDRIPFKSPYEAVDLTRKMHAEGRDVELRVALEEDGQMHAYEDFPPPDVPEEEFLDVRVKVDRNKKDRTWKVSVSCQGAEKSDVFGSDSAAALYVAAAVQDLLNIG